MRKLSKETKRLISDMTVTVLIFSCLGFLIWILHFFESHSLSIKIIST